MDAKYGTDNIQEWITTLGSSPPDDRSTTTGTSVAPMVLIVEDDSSIACSLAIRLKVQGFRSCTATDANAALETAREHEPDCAILDVNVPGGDGFMVADRLRKEPKTRDLPVVFLTASMLPELRKKAEAFPDAAFMTKPYEAKELLATVRELIEGRCSGSADGPL
ncbi:response regulator [Saltatorellus ferox]|uniref:response regulator n=1 Tax=Saltatorellus ferox TaxID=2528018 RepID=UPI003AF3D1BC